MDPEFDRKQREYEQSQERRALEALGDEMTEDLESFDEDYYDGLPDEATDQAADDWERWRERDHG